MRFVAPEALEQAMQQMQQMQQQMQQMSGQQDGSGAGSGEEQDGDSTSSIEIPLPEEFIAPEEYRRLLLQGMTGDVPEEYRAMKQRYYEELVTQ